MAVEPRTQPSTVRLLDRLRARGWRVTAQRRAVAEALEGEHVHLTVDEVHRGAKERLPEVSLATVYNTLNELVVMGEVGEVRCVPGPSRYDPNVGTTPHHHLVCTGCGTLFDVLPEGVDGLQLPAAERHGFALADVEVTFRGRCAACSAA